jgi:hypothetical protein
VMASGAKGSFFTQPLSHGRDRPSDRICGFQGLPELLVSGEQLRNQPLQPGVFLFQVGKNLRRSQH